MKFSSLAFLVVSMTCATTDAFQSTFVSNSMRTQSCNIISRSRPSEMTMFLEGFKANKTPNTVNQKDTTKLGTLEIPSIGIGTISWSSSSLTTLENLELQQLVKGAYNENSAFFDTAERYGSHLKAAIGLGWGETESMLQKLLRAETKNVNQSEQKLEPVVATKFTPSPWRSSVQSVVDACEDSRKRLGVEQIDLYQLHMPDIVQPLKRFGIGSNKNEIYWEGLAECYKRGLVKNVGVCNYGPTLLSQCQEALAKHNVPLASNQIAYSLIGRHNGAQETVDKCNELGIKVLAYYPFAMGLLTGKYSKESLASLDESLSTSTKSALEIKDLKTYADDIGPLLEEMEIISKRRGKTLAQIALNYVICKGAVPIPGSRSIRQLKDNIGAMNWRLSASEIRTLEAKADGVGFEGAGFKRTSEKFVGYGVEKWTLD